MCSPVPWMLFQKESVQIDSALGLLRFHPGIRACKLHGHIRNKDVQGFAVGKAHMLGREKNWTGFFVASPRCQNAARRLRPSAMVDKVDDSTVFTDVEIPGVARGVTAICGILYRN